MTIGHGALPVAPMLLLWVGEQSICPAQWKPGWPELAGSTVSLYKLCWYDNHSLKQDEAT